MKRKEKICVGDEYVNLETKIDTERGNGFFKISDSFIYKEKE